MRVGFGVERARGGRIEPLSEPRAARQATERSPVIDGDLSDAAWAESASDNTFTDQKNLQPVPHQTTIYLGYDEIAIYFAAHAVDPAPSSLVMAATKRDSEFGGDDHITFRIDAYHTHNWNDVSRFSVTAGGTQGSRIAGGRSGKTEWKGDWTGAAKVVEDGYTVEMAIPWAIIPYPNKDEPASLAFNVTRNHARLDYESWYSNITNLWAEKFSADWEGVQLPEGNFTREVLVLPFFAAGAAERENEWEGTARGGGDVRYRPTPQLTGLLTFNPDFRNVENEVAGIDFTRGERRVDESRPFFQEGRDMFRTWSGIGDYFYSRRIEHIDMGTKLYGKLGQ
ncbi:MAG: DUF5916 domain-containing protein, partial [Candidatus Poribacteria bacterium]|nr:DUF5916 domain-containing protein [Candidatus Poribacteria bacterium]